MTILAALSEAPRGLSARQLLDVAGDGTVRTLYRDLEKLQQAGFALSNEDGLWTVARRPRIAIPFTPDEALSLLVALQSVGTATAIAQPLARLRRKVLAGMSPAARAFCEQLGEMAVATTLARSAAPEPLAAAVQEAIAKAHCLAITHASPGQQPRRRVVEPYGLWLADGRAYLVARCRERAQVRHFHLSRIIAAEVLDETFDRDPEFCLEEYVARGFGAFHGPKHHVVIDLDPEVAHAARETRLHESQRVEEREDGGARLHLDIGGLPRLAQWVVGFGGKARAMEPPELVQLVCEIAACALAGQKG